jgi:hypothetical protein
MPQADLPAGTQVSLSCSHPDPDRGLPQAEAKTTRRHPKPRAQTSVSATACSMAVHPFQAPHSPRPFQPGNITNFDLTLFHWNDALKLAEMSGDNYWWHSASYEIRGAGSHVLKWCYTKDGSGTTGYDRSWVDSIAWTPEPNVTLDQALGGALGITTDAGGTAWYPCASPSRDGTAAESGPVSNNGTSAMQATVHGPGTITFYWKASSQSGCDGLQFRVDSTTVGWIDGESSWQSRSFQVTGSGDHVLCWRYIKDASGSSGLDRGWVDQVVWTPGS